MALVTPGERRIGGGVHFTPGGSKLLRSNMHWGCKLLRGAFYFVTGPYTSKSWLSLEAVQKFACKVCLKMWGLDFNTMLYTTVQPPPIVSLS